MAEFDKSKVADNSGVRELIATLGWVDVNVLANNFHDLLPEGGRGAAALYVIGELVKRGEVQWESRLESYIVIGELATLRKDLANRASRERAPRRISLKL